MLNSNEQIGPRPNKKIFNYACAILARRRLSIAEFRNKLEKKFPEAMDSINQVVELFITLKYLDDNEYTRLYLQDQLRRKPQGLRLIKQKLRQKGINEATLSSSFNEQCIDEDEILQQALNKKLRIIKSGSELQKKQKLFRFLVSRGFNQDGILKALRSISRTSIDHSLDQ